MKATRILVAAFAATICVAMSALAGVSAPSFVTNEAVFWLDASTLSQLPGQEVTSWSDVRGEGYDLVRSSGFYDTYELAEERDGGATVIKSIDGWKGNSDAMRLDYIFTSEKQRIKKSRVIFNGGELPVISDHFGVEVCF